MKYPRNIVTVTALLIGLTVFAHADDESLTKQTPLDRLSTVNYHPNLLPIILKNRDFIGLTEEQTRQLKRWGKAHRGEMVDLMNMIIHERFKFEETSLTPGVDAEALREKQNQIFALHRKLLNLKLSCRENIKTTFSAENWESFFVVLAEEGFQIPDSGAVLATSD